jgi:hypothetical protein
MSDGGLGLLQFELRSRSAGSLGNLSAGGLILVAGAAGAVLCGFATIDLQLPVVQVQGGLTPIILLFCAGMVVLGGYLLWHELRLRGYTVRVYERGLELSAGSASETCRWEQVSEVIYHGEPEQFRALQLELKDRPALLFSVDYFDRVDLDKLDGALNVAIHAMANRPLVRTLP